MSSAFLKEGDDTWLHDISPTVTALLNYLTRENSGLPITERDNYYDEQLKTRVYKMSDGFSYIIHDRKWLALED